MPRKPFFFVEMRGSGTIGIFQTYPAAEKHAENAEYPGGNPHAKSKFIGAEIRKVYCDVKAMIASFRGLRYDPKYFAVDVPELKDVMVEEKSK